MADLSLTYYPDITQGQTAEDVRDAVIVFADALSGQLTADLGTAVTVGVSPVLTVPEQYDAIITGQSHIALLKPVAYVFAHNVDPDIVPACVALRPIDGVVGEFYYGQIYASRASGITSLADLTQERAGTLRIAYGDRFSTSNFLIPAFLLKQEAGIHPFLYFKSVEFAGGHDLAAQAVYEGRADVGAGHDGAITILSQTFPDASEVLHQLGHQNIHSDPVVVHTGVLPAPVTLDAIKQACVSVAETQKVKDSLDLFWGWVKGLAPTSHEAYASIETALSGLGLTSADMLG